MDKYEILKNAIADKMFSDEPLAEAIIWYLKKYDQNAYKEIIKILDDIVERKIRIILNEYKDDITN